MELAHGGDGKARPNSSLPLVRLVGPERAWAWLALGWNDLTRTPAVSYTYGIAVVLVSLGLTAGLWLLDLFYLVLPLACGFMFVGPIVAVGLYEVSRRLQAGEPVTLRAALGAFTRNPLQLALMGLVLMLAVLFWVRTALLLFAMFFAQQPPVDLRSFVDLILFSSASPAFLFVGCLVGGIIAAAVFAVSAVSVPMLLDRDCDVFSAVVTSIQAVLLNWRTMMLWAALVAFYTAAGLVTGFLGLAIAMPLLAHASWHAYRDVVVP